MYGKYQVEIEDINFLNNFMKIQAFICKENIWNIIKQRGHVKQG